MAAELRPGRAGFIDKIVRRVDRVFSDEPFMRVVTLEDFVALSLRRRAKNLSVLISITEDKDGSKCARAVLRSQTGSQADVTVLDEEFPSPGEGEAEDDWRLRVAQAVDSQLLRVQDQTSLAPSRVDLSTVKVGQLMGTPEIIDRELMRERFTALNLEPIAPIPLQPDLPTPA